MAETCNKNKTDPQKCKECHKNYGTIKHFKKAPPKLIKRECTKKKAF